MHDVTDGPCECGAWHTKEEKVSADPQLEAVYGAEDLVGDPWEITDTELSYWEGRIEAAFRDGGWFLPEGKDGQVRIVLGDDTGAEENGLITVREDELSVLTLAHEAAHLAVWHDVKEDHDATFCAAYLWFVHELGGQDMAQELAYQFGQMNVEVTW